MRALDEVKTKTLTNSLEYLSDNYLHRGICWALIFKYSSGIELYLNYLPETMHDIKDFWFTPPFKCEQQSHLIDVIEKRIELLKIIKNNMEKSQQLEGVTV